MPTRKWPMMVVLLYLVVGGSVGEPRVGDTDEAFDQRLLERLATQDCDEFLSRPS